MILYESRLSAANLLSGVCRFYFDTSRERAVADLAFQPRVEIESLEQGLGRANNLRGSQIRFQPQKGRLSLLGFLRPDGLPNALDETLFQRMVTVVCLQKSGR